MSEPTWVVEYKTLDDVIRGGWTHHDSYPNDYDGAMGDCVILRQAFVHVRMGEEITRVEWLDV